MDGTKEHGRHGRDVDKVLASHLLDAGIIDGGGHGCEVDYKCEVGKCVPSLCICIYICFSLSNEEAPYIGMPLSDLAYLL